MPRVYKSRPHSKEEKNKQIQNRKRNNERNIQERRIKKIWRDIEGTALDSVPQEVCEERKPTIQDQQHEINQQSSWTWAKESTGQVVAFPVEKEQKQAADTDI
jgi:hypothetical protein